MPSRSRQCRELARTPRRMRVPHAPGSAPPARSLGAGVGSDAADASRSANCTSPRSPAAKPFIGGIRTDAETAAQLPPVHAFQHARRTNSCRCSIDRPLSQWHGPPPGLLIHAILRCQPVPRTPAGATDRARPSTASRQTLRSRPRRQAPKPPSGAPTGAGLCGAGVNRSTIHQAVSRPWRHQPFHPRRVGHCWPVGTRNDRKTRTVRLHPITLIGLLPGIM